MGRKYDALYFKRTTNIANTAFIMNNQMLFLFVLGSCIIIYDQTKLNKNFFPVDILTLMYFYSVIYVCDLWNELLFVALSFAQTARCRLGHLFPWCSAQYLSECIFMNCIFWLKMFWISNNWLSGARIVTNDIFLVHQVLFFLRYIFLLLIILVISRSNCFRRCQENSVRAKECALSFKTFAINLCSFKRQRYTLIVLVPNNIWLYLYIFNNKIKIFNRKIYLSSHKNAQIKEQIAFTISKRKW